MCLSLRRGGETRKLRNFRDFSIHQNRFILRFYNYGQILVAEKIHTVYLIYV